VLELGSVQVPEPVTDLALVQKGALASRYLAGTVGGGLLRRFDITFDYGRQRLYFQPNANFNRPDAYDRAGLWLNRADAGFQVMDVVAGGPAAEAGLKAGDTIVAVDGQAAKELILPDVRTRLKESPPGTRVRLTVRSGEGAREVTVVLRDLV
jgi:C-terminal processing protease CtpA/Prc